MTRVDNLAVFFRAHPCEWIDGRELGRIGGTYAWRSRVSDLRRAPWSMTIENRQRRVRVDNQVVIVSEYRFVPEAASDERREAEEWALTP